jgi:hypothetical protein
VNNIRLRVFEISVMIRIFGPRERERKYQEFEENYVMRRFIILARAHQGN